MKLLITIFLMIVLMDEMDAGQFRNRVRNRSHSNHSTTFNSDNDSSNQYANCFQKGPASRFALDMRKQSNWEREQARQSDKEQNYQYKKKMLDLKYNSNDETSVNLRIVEINKKVKRFEIKLDDSKSLDVKRSIEIGE